MLRSLSSQLDAYGTLVYLPLPFKDLVTNEASYEFIITMELNKLQNVVVSTNYGDP